ncbi:MAG: asparagine synthase (glutamine-hydrolyzing) [Candidatus Auribacterota bacterium]
MCGITGFTVNKQSQYPDQSMKILDPMRKAIQHRGPDDMKDYIDQDIAIGFCRLSIIDLSTGAQPLYNEDHSIVVVCNGEIYNYKELRRKLEEKGHRFVTESDCEVIVHLYEDEGVECVHHLDGMFGICIWDIKKKRLVLFRDRRGIKPLYYYWKSGLLVFSSELKGILLHPAVSRTVDRESLGFYITLNYVPYPNTIIENVFKLPPGHCLVFENGSMDVHAYNSDMYRLPGSRNMDEKQWVFTLREFFWQAVQKRLMADVPLGVLLSGGIDSSGIVAALSRLGASNIPTFSVIFSKMPGYSEEQYSSMIAKYFNTNHTVLNIDADCLDYLEEVVYQMDEPIADKALIPTYLIFKEASKYVKVVLSGEGADEIFLGYHKYNNANRLPSFALPCINMLHPLMCISRRAEKLLNYFSLPVSMEKAVLWDMVFMEQEKRALLKQDFFSTQSVESVCHGKYASAKNLISMMQWWDLFYYLPENLLMKVDKLSMVHGVEARVPYLDISFSREVLRVPASLKLKGGTTKYILRKMFQELLPEEIVRRRKHGFTLPVKEWIKNDRNGIIARSLDRQRLDKSIFNRSRVEQLYSAHKSGKEDHTRQLWNIITWQLWADHYGIS